MTTLTLNSRQIFLLELDMAKAVHAIVLGMHCRAVGTMVGGDDLFRRDLQEWREVLRSMSVCDRRDFVFGVRRQFKRLRAEHGTEVRTRDYVAKCKAFQEGRAA